MTKKKIIYKKQIVAYVAAFSRSNLKITPCRVIHLGFAAMILTLALFHNLAAHAVEPDEILDNPVLEQRARDLSKELRCLVCQNQSIDDSDADLARDLRILVRERLVEGDSDEEVLDYLVKRYGHYVLLNPPMNLQTLVLWGGPILIFGAGTILVYIWFARRTRRINAQEEADIEEGIIAPKGLTIEEEARLAQILGQVTQENEAPKGQSSKLANGND